MASSCQHGSLRPCPWPGCPAGVIGERLVIAGPHAVVYLARRRAKVDRTPRFLVGASLRSARVHGATFEIEGWRWAEYRREAR